MPNTKLAPYIKKVYWQDIRKDVLAVNPEIVPFIDEANPGKDMPLYIAKYRYGDVIVDEGEFSLPLPDTGELVPSLDERLPKDVREDLQYTNGKFPPGIILKNTFELSVNPKRNFISWLFYKPGTIFALWKFLGVDENYHPANFFTITAGAKSIFMLPNIGDLRYHRNLQSHFNLCNLLLPKTLTDQWPVFVKLVNSPIAQCDWSVNMVFFTKKWVEKIKSYENKWLKLHCFLQDYVTTRTDFWRNKVFIDHAFSCALSNRNMRPNPYLADTAKHLITIALGEMPAFVPAIDDSAAPIRLIQKIYLEHYKLKDYTPTIFHTVHFSLKTSRPIYYSLPFPTTAEFSPKCRKMNNILYDIKELKYITDRFIEEIINEKLRLEGTPVKRIIQQLNFDYFHSNLDTHKEIRSTKEMPAEDPALVQCPADYPNKEFAYTSTLIRGCVRISSKKTK